MDAGNYPYLLIGTLGIVFSGLLGAAHRAFLFFRSYQERIEEESINKIAVKSIELWKREGYSEIYATGRLIFDGAALLAFMKIFPGIFNLQEPLILYPVSFLVTTAIIILISHLIFPVAGLACIHKSAGPLYLFFSLYWLALGWLGKIIFSINKLILKKIGFTKTYKIVSEDDFIKMDNSPTTFRETGLEDDEAKMVQNIFNISSTLVKEVLTPRIDTVAIESCAAYEEVLEVIKSTRYTRIPVYKDTIDSIIGVLHVKDLLALTDRSKINSFDLKKIIRPANFIPRSKKIDVLMQEFKRKHTHMAIVVDEYGGTAGIITLEDILEEIVGEIQDEDDVEIPKIFKSDNGSFIIDPVIALDDLNKELDIFVKPEEEVDIDTLGGFLQYLRGTVPNEGDIIETDDFTFKILKMDDQSIEKVQLTMEKS